MDINEIVNWIPTVGFPIIMCMLFFRYFTEEYKSEQEKTREVMNSLKDTINELKYIVAKTNNKGDEDE